MGKSYVVEKFAKMHFGNLITVNFEFAPHFISCFETLDPAKIIRAIEVIRLTGKRFSEQRASSLTRKEVANKCPVMHSRAPVDVEAPGDRAGASGVMDAAACSQIASCFERE